MMKQFDVPMGSFFGADSIALVLITKSKSYSSMGNLSGAKIAIVAARFVKLNYLLIFLERSIDNFI